VWIGSTRDVGGRDELLSLVTAMTLSTIAPMATHSATPLSTTRTFCQGFRTLSTSGTNGL